MRISNVLFITGHIIMLSVRRRAHLFDLCTALAVAGAVFLVLLWQPAAGICDPGYHYDSLQQAAHRLRANIAQGHLSGRFRCAGEMLCGISSIPGFYARRDYQPAWISRLGLRSQAYDLINALRKSRNEGLTPQAYHLTRLTALAGKFSGHADALPDPGVIADLDLLLTDAFLLYASHLAGGRVNPETIHSDWSARSPRFDLVALLAEALEEDRVEETLTELRPPHPEYHVLRQALARYRSIKQQGGWPQVPTGAILQASETGPRVESLRKRLRITGDCQTLDRLAPAVMDDHLTAAVQRFQQRHGLRPDGRVGPKTLQALNVPVVQRIKQIELNLERWRWLPHKLGEKHIRVNIAGFHLAVVENGGAKLHMRVVVGRTFRKTPVFSAPLKYLVFNPHWNVPHRLASIDILPKAQKDPNYLIRQKFEVFESWQRGAVRLEPQDIDWTALTPRTFAYRLRQAPGPSNALGRVKFIFPNPYAVYMHDTPARELFKAPTRGFSSGCIRVEEPIALAANLLAAQSGWKRDVIVETIAAGEQRVVLLAEEVPVHIMYWTAWVDHAGRTHFRHDIYHRDEPLLRALQQNSAPIT